MASTEDLSFVFSSLITWVNHLAFSKRETFWMTVFDVLIWSGMLAMQPSSHVINGHEISFKFLFTLFFAINFVRTNLSWLGNWVDGSFIQRNLERWNLSGQCSRTSLVWHQLHPITQVNNLAFSKRETFWMTFFDVLIWSGALAMQQASHVINGQEISFKFLCTLYFAINFIRTNLRWLGNWVDGSFIPREKNCSGQCSHNSLLWH